MNTRIKIAEMSEKSNIEDSNLIIIEDSEDTKKSSINELKKSFSGDEYLPSKNKFYSSEMTNTIINNIKRSITNKADQKDVENLKETINSIVTSNGSGKDTELVQARNGKSTLSERLEFDLDNIDKTYIKRIKRNITGKTIDIKNHIGFVDIVITQTTKKETVISSNKLNIYSKNILDYTKITNVSGQLNKENNGFRYNQKTNGITNIDIPLSIIYKAGSYKFLSEIIKFNNFRVNSIKFNITYSDGTVESLPYNHQEEFIFETKKGFNKITLVYNSSMILNESSISFKNIMIVPDKNEITGYIPYERFSYNISIGSTIYNFLNKNYIFESDISNGEISIDYYDNNITMESLNESINDIYQNINNKLDKCGLIEEYGTYQFLDNIYISSNEDDIKIKDSEYNYRRNGKYSKKITISENATNDSFMRIPLDNNINIINNIGLFFYIDKITLSYFNIKTGGIKIRLVSDLIEIQNETNYYEYLITKNEMVQGWNFVKKLLREYTVIGSPDPNNIQYIAIQICRNSEMNGKSLYLNSIVFNQRMKPTVLLGIEGVYDNSISYLYPYLESRGISPTIFLNSKQTLTSETLDTILRYTILNGWDIGLESSHPNKDVLTQDDNFKNQYNLLKTNYEWLNDSLIKSPISFNAPYGNLRPITVPILKDLGFKISKSIASDNCYCGFFSDKDFAVSSILLSNNITADEIIEKIDYAIESGQTIILTINNVTEYGSEIDCRKLMFESIIYYIIDRINDNSLWNISFKDFYSICVDLL